MMKPIDHGRPCAAAMDKDLRDAIEELDEDLRDAARFCYTAATFRLHSLWMWCNLILHLCQINLT